MTKFRVIDADGHCVERDDELAEYVVYRGRPLRTVEQGVGSLPFFPSLDGWFPTAGLAYGLIQDREWAISLGRAYNDWLSTRYVRRDPRFRGLALVPVQDVP